MIFFVHPSNWRGKCLGIKIVLNLDLIVPATSLGNGVYFSVNSFFYDRELYTPLDPSGYRRMYRVRVLTGDYKIGSPKFYFSPLKSRNPHVCYHSVTNSVHNPTVFMVFKDVYSCPEHIITYL